MPFKSKAQMRKFYAMESRGEVPEGTAHRWAKHTPDIKSLPEKKEKDSDSEKKAAFIQSFIASFHRYRNSPEITKTAADWSGVLNSDFLKQLAGYAAVPALAGGMGGVALAKATSPSAASVSNLQKQELLAQYDLAIEELQRRIAARSSY